MPEDGIPSEILLAIRRDFYRKKIYIQSEGVAILFEILRENCCNSPSTIREEAKLFAEARAFKKMEDLNDPPDGEEK